MGMAATLFPAAAKPAADLSGSPALPLDTSALISLGCWQEGGRQSWVGVFPWSEFYFWFMDSLLGMVQLWFLGFLSGL